MNRYTATGFLTADPELRQLPSGSAVCNMRLAVKGMARIRDRLHQHRRLRQGGRRELPEVAA